MWAVTCVFGFSGQAFPELEIIICKSIGLVVVRVCDMMNSHDLLEFHFSKAWTIVRDRFAM